jgi:hypothetical protein
MNLMNVVISRLCFVSDCFFFYKLNADCVFNPAVTGELMSASLLLLLTRVAMGNDVRTPIAIMSHSSDGRLWSDSTELPL